MFVLVRFLFVLVIRMVMLVLCAILSVFMVVSRGMLTRVTVLGVAVLVPMVVFVSVFVLVFHNSPAQKCNSLE
jgi:hypothetical protein